MRSVYTNNRSVKRLQLLGFGMFCVVACAPPVPIEEAPIEGGGTKTPTPSKGGTHARPGSDDVTSEQPDSGPASTGEPSSDPSTPFPAKDDHVPVIDPEYPGIDVALTGTDAPIGCVDGWDENSRSLVLELDENIPGVRVHVEGDVLHANGHACQANGDSLSPDDIQTLSIRGGGEANLVILDFAVEGFGETLFEQEGGFRLDGGKGEDVLYIRGSEGADEFYVGAVNQRLVAALSSFPRINLWAKSFERARVSLGPGDDAWRAITRLNLGLFDLDSGSVLNINGIDLPQELWGGAGHDELNAGKHDDYLNGGTGDDELNGGEGGDRFDEGGSQNGRDTINGGAGLDEISYAQRINDVTVEMCTTEGGAGCDEACDCEPTSGAADEQDRVINIEIVSTGVGDDVIIGTPGADYIYAGAGDDVIRAGAGSDVLQGGRGDDDLDGGGDEDICDSQPHEARISCEI